MTRPTRAQVERRRDEIATLARELDLHVCLAALAEDDAEFARAIGQARRRAYAILAAVQIVAAGADTLAPPSLLEADAEATAARLGVAIEAQRKAVLDREAAHRRGDALTVVACTRALERAEEDEREAYRDFTLGELARRRGR